jgi:hypothetical protein
MVSLIKKGTIIHIYNANVYGGQVMDNFTLVLGKDFLKSDDDYMDYNGALVISEDEVDNAVSEYMDSTFPNVFEYSYELEED